MKEIHLNKGFVALVDDDDYSFLSKSKWRIDSKGYAVKDEIQSDKKQKMVLMHRKILSLSSVDKLCVDHINRNPLDNRRSNLRICTHAENMRNSKLNVKNTSGFKGVTWHKQIGKWMAQISLNGKRKYLGVFYDPIDAHEAYKIAALKMHGEFASFGISKPTGANNND